MTSIRFWPSFVAPERRKALYTRVLKESEIHKFNQRHDHERHQHEQQHGQQPHSLEEVLEEENFSNKVLNVITHIVNGDFETAKNTISWSGSVFIYEFCDACYVFLQHEDEFADSIKKFIIFLESHHTLANIVEHLKALMVQTQSHYHFDDPTDLAISDNQDKKINIPTVFDSKKTPE